MALMQYLYIMTFFILPGYFVFHFFLFTHFVYSDCKLFRTETVFQYVLDKSWISEYYSSMLCKYLVQFWLEDYHVFL